MVPALSPASIDHREVPAPTVAGGDPEDRASCGPKTVGAITTGGGAMQAGAMQAQTSRLARTRRRRSVLLTTAVGVAVFVMGQSVVAIAAPARHSTSMTQRPLTA